MQIIRFTYGDIAISYHVKIIVARNLVAELHKCNAGNLTCVHDFLESILIDKKYRDRISLGNRVNMVYFLDFTSNVTSSANPTKWWIT